MADVALLGVAAVWGVTFSVVKEATTELPTFHYLAIRFALAALVLAALYPRHFRRLKGGTLKAGVVIGTFLFGGYALQTLGLQTTTPSKAGFITGLAVVIVPLLSSLFLRERPSRAAVAGVVLATAGLGLLTLGVGSGGAGAGSAVTGAGAGAAAGADAAMGAAVAGAGATAGPLIQSGELLVVGCALSFTLHIIAVSRFSARHDPVLLAIVQIAVGSVASAVLAWVFEPPVAVSAIPADVWQAIVITGVFATSAAFLVQTTAQRFTTATHTALIFTMEPVFAAAYSYVCLGEPLTLRGVSGGLLVLAGMLAAQVRTARTTIPGKTHHREAEEQARRAG